MSHFAWIRMRKTGRWRAVRNLPVGWALQAIHSTDRSERWFRLSLEAILILVAAWLGRRLLPPSILIPVAFGSIHSILWLVTGNFWVYLLDSFQAVRNPGMPVILAFLRTGRRWLVRSGSCRGILIYGSLCRKQFHQRSDLDLRVVRRTDGPRGLLSLPIGLALRAWSLFLRLPVDLQVVDSYEFLGRQMRSDERPLVVYLQGSAPFPLGPELSVLEQAPQEWMREG